MLFRPSGSQASNGYMGIGFAYQGGKLADAHIMGVIPTEADCKTKMQTAVAALNKIPGYSFTGTCVAVPNTPAGTPAATPPAAQPPDDQKDTSV